MFTLLFPPIPCVHCQLHSRPIFIGPARAHGPAPRNQRSYLEHLRAQIGTAGLSIARVLSSPRRFRYGGRFGGGERGQCRAETSLGPGRPPARTVPRIHLLSTKINVPLRCPKAPSRLHGIRPVSFPSPLKHPPHEGRKGSSPVSPPPPLARAGRCRVGVPLSTGKWPRDRYSGAAPGGMRQEAGRVLAGSAGGRGVHAEVAAVLSVGRGRRAASAPGRGQGRPLGRTAWQAAGTTAPLTSWFPGNWGEARNSPAPTPQLSRGSVPGPRRCRAPWSDGPDPRQVTLQGDHFLICRLHYFIHSPLFAAAQLPETDTGPGR